MTDEFSPIKNKLNQWIADFGELLPNLLVATLVLLCFVLLAKMIRRIMQKHLNKIVENQAVRNIVTFVTFFTIITLGGLIALSILDLDNTVNKLLAGAGIIGVALGFAFQDTAANILSGIFMAFKKGIREGDLVETHGVIGTIEEIELRSTKLKTLDGYEVIVPNRKIFQELFINYNHYITRRIDLSCGVAYDSNLEHVEAVVLEVLQSIREIRQSPSPEFYYTKFNDHSIDFSCRFWIDFLKVQDYLSAKHEVIKAIKARFDQEGIVIPFPIRTLVWNEGSKPVLKKEE